MKEPSRASQAILAFLLLSSAAVAQLAKRDIAFLGERGQAESTFAVPKPSRWRDPEGRLKPRHVAPLEGERLELTPTGIMPLAPGPGPAPPDLGRICIIVHSSISSQISAALSQYQSDLVAAGYTTTVYT